MMISSIFALSVFLLLLSDQTVPAVSTGPYCREIHTVTRCVERRLIRGANPWCVFHICGPKFVKANRCPPGTEQATHKCEVKRGRRNTWVCIEGKRLRNFWLPLGCTGNRCQKEVMACRCERRFNDDRTKYVSLDTIPTPQCGGQPNNP